MKPKFSLRSNSFGQILLRFAGLAAVGVAGVQGATWNGTTSQDWNTASNWDVSPGGTNLTINLASGNFPIISSNATFTPIDVLIGVGAAGRLDHRAGTAATGTGNWLVVGRNNSGNGTYNLADTSTTGGTLTGFGLGSGSMNVGGTSTTIGRLLVGDAGSSTGTVNVNTTGTLKMEQDDIGILLGNGGTTTGNLNLDAGTVQVNSVATNIGILVGTNGGDGNFRMSGGTTNITGGVWLGDNNVNSQGLLQITGGTFNVTASSAIGSTGSGQVFIGRGLGQGTMNVSGGANVTITGSTNIGFTNTATTGTAGTLTVSGGTFNNTGEMRVGSAQNSNTIVAAGTGTFNVTGGSATIGGSLVFGRGNDSGDLVTGNGTVSGGTLTVAGDLVTAYAGNNNLSQFTVSGGTVNVGTTAEKWLHVNQWDTTRGQVTVSSGNLNLNTNSDIRFSTGTGAGGSVGASSVTLSGGAITSFSGNGSGTATSGVVDLNNNGGAASNNTFNLNGGTLTIAQVITTSNNGTATFNFNGGLLKAANASTNFVDLGGASQSAKVLAGGALIDTNGYNVTITEKLVTGAVSDGGLTKSGLGTLTLSAANTYNGATSVNAGSLLLTSTGSLATSGVTVASTASLGGSGSIAGSVTSAGQLLPGGPSTIGTLTIGNGLTLSGGNIALDLNGTNNATGGGTNDLLAITGNVSLSGTVIISPSFSTTPAASTSYTFGTYTGTLTGGSNFAAGSRAITLDTATTGQLKLTYTGAASGNLNWSSTSSSAWDVVNTLNWNNTSTSSPDRFYQNDTVTFDNTSGLQTSVVLNTTILPGSVVVNSDSTGNNYTFSGTGGLGGASSLTKSGSSTLTLTTANSYTGATAINGGTLQLDGSLGGTAISVASGATLNESSTGSIGGSASLSISGTATLAGINTYSGATNVNSGGSLSVNSSAALGGAGSSLTLNSGTLTTTNSGLFTNGARAITIGAGGGTLNINSTGTAGTGQFFINTANTLLGSGALTVTGNGTLGSSGAGNFRVGSTNTFSGSITLRSGGSFEYGVANAVASTTTVSLGNEGEIISNNNAVPLNVSVDGGTNSVLSFANGSTGSFTGGVTLNANGTVALRDWYNPAVVRSGTISGVVSGSGGLIVNSGTGTGGTLTLAGVNTFTGDITANASSNVTIGAAGRIGSGSYAGNIAMNGGTFTYGGSSSQTLSGVISGSGGVYASGSGTLSLSGANTFTGKTTINAGGVLSVTSLNSVSGGSASSSLGAPTTVSNGTIDMTGVAGNGTLIYTGSGETTDRVINLAAGATAGLSAVIDQSGSGNLKFTSNLTATGAQTHTLVLKGSTSGTGEIAGAIVDNSGTNKTSVTKEGSGTWNLSGNSTYTGATTVSAGTLFVNGSLGNTAVTVNGGTLGGTATIGTSGASLTVNSGGTLAPGNSPGTLVVNGSTSLNSGSTYAFQYTGGGSAADLVDVNGTLTLDSSALLTLEELGNYTVGDKFTLFSYDSLVGSFDAYVDGNVYTFNGGDWLFSYNDSTAGLNGGIGNGYITITAVPEPSALLLSGAAVLGLAFRRRRSASV